MASRNMKSPYESMDKMPSNTLKRHPKMDLNKNDLLRLLSYLEGELQARDISIAALKAEKAKQLLYQAKYGRFGLGDPFHALQRDSDRHKDNSFDETAVKSMYDNQLLQLENLIATQRKAQQRMREQLAAVEKRYHKVCAELEEEKQKHAQDTAQGDDVTYMLEKDRERLKQELDFEKGQVKKLEKENKKLTTSLEEERALSSKHKQVALVLIKERRHYVEKAVVLHHHNMCMESVLKDDQSKLKTLVEGLAQESHKSLMMEAAVEKQLAEFDTEKEQLKGRLVREEGRNAELIGQVEYLQQQLEQLQRAPQGSRGASPASSLQPIRPVPGQNVKVFKNTPPSTPPETRRLPYTHERDPVSVLPPTQGRPLGVDSVGKHLIGDVNNGSLVGKSPERSLQHYVSPEKPVPAEKPMDLNSSRVNIISSGATVFSQSSGNTTVFTTPSGTRISLNVGSSSPSSSTSPRKPAPLGRGVPPPLPPNKPQVYIPQTGTPVRKENMVRSGGGTVAMSSTVDSGTSQPPSAMSQQSPLQKLGITISKDKITISNPHSSHQGLPGVGTGALGNANMVQSSSADQSATGGHKAAQVGLRY